MSKGLILYDDKVHTGAIHTSSHSWWENPENVQDECIDTKAVIGNSATTLWHLDFDFGAAVTIGCWGIIGHDLYDLGYSDLYLFVGSADNGSTYDVTQDRVRSIQSHAEYQPNVCKVFSGATKRYWRIKTSAAPTAAYLHYGVVFLGTYCESDAVPDPAAADDHRDQVLLTPSMGSNAPRIDKGAAHTISRLQWGRGSSTLRSDLLDIWAAQDGSYRPVIYVDHNNEGDVVSGYPGNAYGDVRYCCLERPSVAHVHPGRFGIQHILRDVT